VASGAAGVDSGHAGVIQSFRDTPRVARFVLLGVFVNQFGAFLQAFLVLYLTQRDFSSGQAGIALGFYSVGAIAGTLFGGSMFDRLGPRWTIVFSVGSAAMFTLSITLLDSLPAIVTAVALAGAMTQSSRPAVTALLFSLVPPSRQVMILSMYRTSVNAGIVIGPLVAVWLSTISWNLVFYFDAASALLYAAIAATLLPRREKNTDTAPATSADGTPVRRAGFATLLHDRRYLAFLLLMLGNGLVHVQFFAVVPLMLKAAGYPTWVYGAASGMAAFIIITCELAVTRFTQTWTPWVAVIAGWVLLVVGRGAYWLPGGLAIIFTATVLAAVGQIIGGAQAFAYPARVAPPGATGRYIGSAHATFGLGYAIGPVVGIMLWNGLGNTFWLICFALGLVVIVPGIWGMRPTATVTVPPPAPEPPPPAPAAAERGDPGQDRELAETPSATPSG
jgi:MFS family permease